MATYLAYSQNKEISHDQNEYGDRRWRLQAASYRTSSKENGPGQENEMTGWRSRILMIAALWVFVFLHSKVTANLPNSPLGMLLFHGSAGLGDLALIYCAPTFLSGPVCDDTEILCLISIVANFIGWLLYLAYTPPEFYNSFMWGLGCVQSIRLFIVDSDDLNGVGRGLVCRPSLLGA